MSGDPKYGLGQVAQHLGSANSFILAALPNIHQPNALHIIHTTLLPEIGRVQDEVGAEQAKPYPNIHFLESAVANQVSQAHGHITNVINILGEKEKPGIPGSDLISARAYIGYAQQILAQIRTYR